MSWFSEKTMCNCYQQLVASHEMIFPIQWILLILRHPNMEKPFILDSNSSQYNIGTIFQQYFRDSNRKQQLYLLGYKSKKLIYTEQCYSSQERKCFPTKYALNHWCHILKGLEIIIYIDHKSQKVYQMKHCMKK